MNVVFFGPPGSGKGTQAGLLCGRLDLTHVSSGDILREVRKKGGELGKRIGEIIGRGEYVPDEIVQDLVLQEVKGLLARRRGILFDGFPRTLDQLKVLEGILDTSGSGLDYCITFDLEDDKLVRRLAGRRICEKCQRTYNVETHPPKKSETCDACGGRLIQRSDDRPEAIRQRLVEYRHQTEPILKDLSRRSKLWRVAADGSIESIHGKVMQIVQGGREELSLKRG